MLALFLCGEFLLYVPCGLLFFNLGSFSYTFRARLLFSSGEYKFLLHIPCLLYFSLGSLSYISSAGFFFSLSLFFFFLFFFFFKKNQNIWGVSLTHPMLASFLCGEFLLHILCWLFSFSFYLGSSSYTSRAGLIFIWGVSLTYLLQTLYGEFLLIIPCCFDFYARSFSYTFSFSFLSGKFH